MQTTIKTLILTASLIFLIQNNAANAQNLPPSKNLIDAKVIESIKEFINTDIVIMSTVNQNKKYGAMDQNKINELDNQWRAETKSDNQPLISAILANPLSSYLTRVQAHSIGLYTEMFVMDFNGLNVGQSNISSDFWQGDEAKFQKTYGISSDAVYIDDPEYDEDKGIWRVQVSMTIANREGNKIGAVTVEINLSELQRRNMMSSL